MEIRKNEENYKTFALPFDSDDNCIINSGNDSFIHPREDSIQISKLLEQMHENEERLIFNQLIITLVLELLAILIFIAFFLLNDSVFEAKLNDGHYNMNLRLMFSMRSFSLERLDNSWIINHYFCIWKDECMKINFEEVYRDFEVDKEDIKHISVASIIVRTYFLTERSWGFYLLYWFFLLLFVQC